MTDRPRPRGIQLVQPDSKFTRIGENFEAPTVDVPAVGPVRLGGDSPKPFAPDDGYELARERGIMSVRSINKEVIANRKDLYDLIVRIGEARVPLVVTCEYGGRRLISTTDLYVDERDPDPSERYKALTGNWTLEGEKVPEGKPIERPLYAPDDPELLSNAYFNFSIKSDPISHPRRI